MDLGIAGRKAIVCASSRGLGKACARALAEAGCEVVINGRDAKTLNATATELANITGAKIIAVVADVSTAEGQKALTDRIAMKRLGTTQDIANGVLFFASPLGSFVNGQILSVDGGK
jgi:NAD(P)-dependent dehydrogenase (short-subunit alcohol dehydrogenase family)